MIQNRVIRRMGATELISFASAMCRVRREYMYAMDSCEQQFQLFQETMTELIDTCFPLKTVTRHSSDKPWVTDRFRHLIRQRQRARMSGDLAEGRRLRNLVNRAAPQLRQQFYQSKIASMEESSTPDWWKQMKILMGTSCEGNSEMQGLVNKHTEGDMCSLVNSVNEFFVSVSEDLHRLQASYSIFDVSKIR